MTMQDLLSDYRSASEFAVLMQGRMIATNTPAAHQLGKEFNQSWAAAQAIVSAAGGIQNVTNASLHSSSRRADLTELERHIDNCLSATRQLAEIEHYDFTWKDEAEHSEYGNLAPRPDNKLILDICADDLKSLKAAWVREDEAAAEQRTEAATAAAQAAADDAAKELRLSQPSILEVKTGRLLPTRRAAIALLISYSLRGVALPEIVQHLRSFGLSPDIAIDDCIHFFADHVTYTGQSFSFALLDKFADDFEVREVRSHEQA